MTREGTGADPGEPSGDDGLANERTTLAWVRTALATVALGALVARHSGDLLLGGVVITLAVLAALSVVVGAERRHHWRVGAMRSGGTIVVARHVVLATAVANGLAGVALLVVLTG